MLGANLNLMQKLEFCNDIGANTPLEAKSTDKRKFTNKTFTKFDAQITDIKSINIDKKIAPAVLPNNNYIQQAEISANAAKNIQELKNVIKNFEGCILKNTAMNTVFADGQPNAQIMLIGEAPGAEEDIQGLPFVGASGKLLDKMFNAIGYNRSSNLYITNVIPWRPPGNRTPTLSEITMCLPFLHRHIELIQPKLCILVGGTAVKAIMGKEYTIGKVRSTFSSFQTFNTKFKVKITAIFHPAYLLRSPGQKKYAWHDLQLIRDYIAAII